MRRALVDAVRTGELALSLPESHHLRDVLRLKAGDMVEVFDPAGNSAQGRILRADAQGVVVHVDEVRPARPAVRFTVAAAIPKGPRADWMVEKLSELGAAAFIPLVAARSVVVPEGVSKVQRWHRLAEESAKQSRRPGVMRIEPAMGAIDCARRFAPGGWWLSTAAGALPAGEAAARIAGDLVLMVGPEGGWTQEEEAAFAQAGLTPVSLGTTILRVETAAIAAAAVVSALAPRGTEEEQS